MGILCLHTEPIVPSKWITSDKTSQKIITSDQTNGANKEKLIKG